MQTNLLNFKKARDFGDVLSDTFTFLKQEYKFLLKVLLMYAGPFVLITAIAAAWMQSSMFSIMSSMLIADPISILYEFGLKFTIYGIAALISNTVLICTIYSYIKLYIEKGKDGFTQEEVWQSVGKKFFTVLGTVIVMALIISVGIILCIIPGIYLSIALILVLGAIFFEDMSMGNAMQRSMFLVRDDWWFTFGISIVIYMLIGVVSYIFVLPTTIMSVFLTVNSVQGNSSEGFSIVFMILTTISTFCVSILSCIPHISFSLLYHGQVEKKESPGLMNKIDQINQPNTTQDEKPKY